MSESLHILVLSPTCDMTQPYVWHDSFMWAMSYMSVSHVTSHLWMRHATRMHEWVTPPFLCLFTRVTRLSPHDSQMRHATRMNGWVIHKWVTSPFLCSLTCTTWLSPMCDMTQSYVWHDSFICEPRHTWVSRHVTRMNETCHTYEWVSHLTLLVLIYTWDKTQTNVWHDSIICEPRHTWVCVTSRHTYAWDLPHVWMSEAPHPSCAHWRVRHHSALCVTSLSPMCDMTQPYVWHDSALCVTWLIRMWAMSYMGMSRHVSRMNESWMSHITKYVWMSHVTHMHASCRTYECGMLRTWMSHVTHMNESCHTYGNCTQKWVMPHIWMGVWVHACVCMCVCVCVCVYGCVCAHE